LEKQTETGKLEGLKPENAIKNHDEKVIMKTEVKD